VDSLVDSTGQVVAKYSPHVVRRVIDAKAAATTVEALKSVVEKGTAEKAALEHYTVAGKTGTAQKVVNGQYSHDKYFASFIGFFPADDPEQPDDERPAPGEAAELGEPAGPPRRRAPCR
jgi:cell division protein FtsI/penicillin-binding protein 2